MAVKKKTAVKRDVKPIRYKVLRVDAFVQNAQRTIEKKFGLPEGAVRLVYPSGRKARSDGKIGALLKRWELKS